MQNLDQLVNEAKQFATKIIIDYPDRMVYHDIKFAKRFTKLADKISKHVKFTKEEQQLGQIAAWLAAASREHFKLSFDKAGNPQNNLVAETLKTANVFFKQYPIDEVYRKQLNAAFEELDPMIPPKTKLGKLLIDASNGDLVMGNARKHLKKLYEEMLLNDVNISKKKWYDIAINIGGGMRFHLPYCQEEMQPKLDELTASLKKEKKELDRNTDRALKKELDISEQELKELKKNLKKSKARDDRGIQTIFRTTSKNHYTMNEMVDRKANIMITVNSIILSLMLGGIIGQENEYGFSEITWRELPILVLTLACIGSIVFAIFAIRPSKTHGRFTEDEVRNKGGNLLYFGNFHDMHARDYEWAFLQMMNDKDYLYSNMIKDIYFLGRALDKKYLNIRKSLNIFLVGLILAVLIRLIGNVIYSM